MLENLMQLDEDLFLFLNGLHSTYFDTFMSLFTGKWIWIIMYATIIYVLFRSYKWQTALYILIAVGITITLSDQLCASVIRPFAERLRPSNINNPIAPLVHVVNGNASGYGFPSCHASNSFALAFFIMFLFRKKWVTVFIMSWATINCYTRIYLGYHYPGDLLTGAVLGFCCSAPIYFIASKIVKENLQKRAWQTELIAIVGLLIIIGIAIYSAITMAE